MVRVLAASALVCGVAAASVAVTATGSGPAFADGPAACSVGGPPFPFAGFCATYSGDNTWFGSYGPGFPTDEGWGFCADPPASGGDYPAPVYAYVPSGAPTGAITGQADALGFAFSEAQALGWWGGSPGQFTEDQAAVAGKLLYDAVVWASPVPAMDPGVLAAYQALDGWYVQAIGATDVPQFTVELVGGGSSFTSTATIEVQAMFPGTDNAVTGLPVELTVSGATIDGPSGPTTVTAATDGSGTAAFPINASAPGPVTATVDVPGGLGQLGLVFFAPSEFEPTAQQLAAFSAPTAFSAAMQLTSLPSTGTVSILKAGDDTAYYPVGGAVFEVLSGTQVVATLMTAADGTTPESAPLPVGTYTIHEDMPPPGYGSAPDQSVEVVAGANTVAAFSGAEGDRVTPASLTLEKTDAETGGPLAGAVFDVAYDAGNDGTFRDIGTCTTTATGTCTPAGNDGPAQLLPGDYEVTETAAPAGYAIPSPASQVIDLLANENATVSFDDPKLVSAVFQKVASGNLNPAELVLDGALIDIDEGTPGGPSVATCSTNASGTCVTPAALESGTRYCWLEVLAPPGLAGGANGCFTADNDQADRPITVTDPGKFVAIQVVKVDAADPSVGLPGALFDLYRQNTASEASAMPYPEAPASSSETLVATATTGAGGIGTFPLQLPGYSYCAVEVQAPSNYEIDTGQQCTAVLAGTTVVPGPVTTLTFKDTEQTVAVTVYKYDSLTPDTGIAGATYDLYVQGQGPPSGVPGPAPAGVTDEPGDTWFARGTTGPDGRLAFAVPAGYAWCALEVSAPPDYRLDPALHCSAVVTTSSSPEATTIAIGEARATVHLTAYKYNSHQPSTVIPDATYELLGTGGPAPGAPTSAPADAVVPAGDYFFAEATTDDQGSLSFAVPAGYSWCLHELIAPPAYQPDPAYHCTAVLTTDTTAAAATIAVPEVPMTGSLPLTGFPAGPVAAVGAGLAALGAALWAVDAGRRRRRGA